MKNSSIIILVIVGIVVLAAAWYLASPLFIDRTVDEASPLESVEEASSFVDDSMTLEDTETEVKESIIFQGEFSDADNFHKASGQAIIITEGDKTYLRLENFEVTNGPGLVVYFSTDKSATDYISIGDLKGNVGDQNYDITNENIDLEKYPHVLIWCEPFSVLFGSAELS